MLLYSCCIVEFRIDNATHCTASLYVLMFETGLENSNTKHKIISAGLLLFTFLFIKQSANETLKGDGNNNFIRCKQIFSYSESSERRSFLYKLFAPEQTIDNKYYITALGPLLHAIPQQYGRAILFSFSKL